MSGSLPLVCADCQKLLSIDPDTSDQPDVQKHVAGCAVCGRLAAHYHKIDTLLNQIPDLQPLPDLSLRFQQIPQAQSMAELTEPSALWEDVLEETSSTHFMLAEPATSPFMQGKKIMQKRPIAPNPEPLNALYDEQLKQSLNSTTRPHRSLWRELATTAAVIVVLVNILAWGLLLRLTHQSTLGAKPTAALTPIPPTSTPALTPQSTPMPVLTQQYSFTAQDSGKTITYAVTDRFRITLDSQNYPQKDVRVSCTPAGALEPLSNLPPPSPPLYMIQYMVVQPGTCTIKNGSFLLTVIIVQLSN
jgi:hypothetical protein